MRVRGSESINRPVAMLVTTVRPPVPQKVKLFKRFNFFVALCQETRELLSRGGYPTSRLGVVAWGTTPFFILGDDRYLSGRWRALVEFVAKPFVDETLGQFQADNTRSEGQYLAVVREHRALDRI